MPVEVARNHVTRYRYDRPVALSPQVVRLRPAPHARTPVHAYSLRVLPAKHFINWQQDPQSNWLAPFGFLLEPYAEKSPFKYEDSLLHELAPSLVKLPATPLFKAYLDEIPRAAR